MLLFHISIYNTSYLNFIPDLLISVGCVFLSSPTFLCFDFRFTICSPCLLIRISTTQRSCDCHIVLADKEMVLHASISRYVGAYPIFRMPASYLFSRNLPLPISTRRSCNCLLCAIHINCCSYLFSFILSTNNRDLFVPLQNATRELLSKYTDISNIPYQS